jgi:hypothetical protein
MGGNLLTDNTQRERVETPCARYSTRMSDLSLRHSEDRCSNSAALARVVAVRVAFGKQRLETRISHFRFKG